MLPYENDCNGFQCWDADDIEHEVKTHEDRYDLIKLNVGSRYIKDKKASPLTPAQFKDKMKHAAKLNDLDARHKRMDELMCRQLTALGFGDGIEAFTTADKWYA